MKTELSSIKRGALERVLDRKLCNLSNQRIEVLEEELMKLETSYGISLISYFLSLKALIL